MKALVIIILIALGAFALYYISTSIHRQSTPCPPGSRYVRVVSGGGWADTDYNDPWGSCVTESEIDKAYNQ
jgi:hypothetical protein